MPGKFMVNTQLPCGLKRNATSGPLPSLDGVALKRTDWECQDRIPLGLEIVLLGLEII